MDNVQKSGVDNVRKSGDDSSDSKSEDKPDPTKPMKITIKLDGGNTLCLEGVKAVDLVSSVKEKIEAAAPSGQALPRARQSLIFHGYDMKNEKPLRTYGVEADSELDLLLRPEEGAVRPPGFQIQYKLFPNLISIKLLDDCHGDDTVGMLVERIKAKETFPAKTRMYLTFNGMLLEDDSLLSRCQIRKDSEVVVMINH